VDEITTQLESISFAIAPLSINKAQERLDPLLRLLARSEWNELVSLTREFMYLYRLSTLISRSLCIHIYNNRLLRAAKISPLAVSLVDFI
jgi:hypothetical protein